MGYNVRLNITKKKLWIIVAIFAIVLLLVLLIVLRFIISHGSAGEGERPPFGGGVGESSVIPVSVVEVAVGDIRSTLFYTGELHAEDEVEVYAVASGKVMKYNFNEGDYIKKGEVLLKLERRREPKSCS